MRVECQVGEAPADWDQAILDKPGQAGLGQTSIGRDASKTVDIDSRAPVPRDPGAAGPPCASNPRRSPSIQIDTPTPVSIPVVVPPTLAPSKHESVGCSLPTVTLHSGRQ